MIKKMWIGSKITSEMMGLFKIRKTPVRAAENVGCFTFKNTARRYRVVNGSIAYSDVRVKSRARLDPY